MGEVGRKGRKSAAVAADNVILPKTRSAEMMYPVKLKNISQKNMSFKKYIVKQCVVGIS